MAALIRQESEFDAGVTSRANARGLTQIEPATGREISRKLKIPAYTTAKLFQPSLNLQFGTYYLRLVTDQLGGHTEAALAAYNAGMTRAKSWLTWGDFKEPAEFVETVPFTQTRGYIQAVLRNADAYRRIIRAATAIISERDPRPLPRPAHPLHHRKCHPRDDSSRLEAQRRESGAGIPRFSSPPDREGCGTTGYLRRHQSIRDYVGLETFSRPDRVAEISAALRPEIDPEREITVCCGSTEGMIASLLAVSNPGDEVIIFEPFYENFGPDTLLCDAHRRFVKLHPPDWRFDPDELRRAFSPKTKAIIINSPGNPTGQVFDREQLQVIADLCQEFDALAITDEIYEHIIYDGARHIPMMTLPGMRERTILINSMSKTYAVTGWRVGWVLAVPDITESVRKVHDFLTVGAAAPLQEAGVVALGLPDSYYQELAQHYTERRDLMLQMLEQAGFRCTIPRGAYYVMADFSGLNKASSKMDDVTFARHLIETVGIAAVPGSSFFNNNLHGAHWIRFCFPKKYDTLKEAEARLMKLA